MYHSLKHEQILFSAQAPADQEFIPIEFNIPIQTQPIEALETEPEPQETEPEPQETVEEYINPQGIKMRRIIKRTVITRIVNVNGKPERVEEPHEEVYEEPVADEDQSPGPAVDERIGVMRVQKRVELPDWEPVEIKHRPRHYGHDEHVESVEDKPVKPVFGIRPTKLSSEEIIKPSTVDRSYTLPEFDQEFTIMPDEQPAKPDARPGVEVPSEPKESTVSVRMHEKESPLKFKITTVKKSRVGHVEAGPRKSNEYVDFDEPNKVDFACLKYSLHSLKVCLKQNRLFCFGNVTGYFSML